MGLDANATTCLLYARTLGVSFARTAMLGRQRLVAPAGALRENLAAFGYSLGTDAIDGLLKRGGGYAEPFLEQLGATEICSLDASDWEHASDISDLNSPIGERFQNRFTAVLDGGTLEHVFNFPVAIANCMDMIQVGGHFLAITPTNNFMGHGFYQFSPELFFRVFSASNGFQVVRMIVFENRPRPEWFEVADPAAVNERVGVVNSRPTNLFVIAKKVAAVRALTTPPHQSGYVAAWESVRTNPASRVPAWDSLQRTRDPAAAGPNASHGTHTEPTFSSRLKRKLFRLAPARVQRMYVRFRNPQYRDYPYDPRFFRRIEIPPVATPQSRVLPESPD